MIWFSCIPDKVFRECHQYWLISFLTYPYPTRGTDKKMNNETCCQYIGCIGGHVTLSLRRWELTSLRRHIRRQFSKWRTQRIGTWLVHGDSYIKIRRWYSKGVQEKESIMVVQYGQKNPSLEITVWHHSAQPRDAKQWPSDIFFYPHLTPMKDSYILAYQTLFSAIFTSADKSYPT